MPAPTTEKSSMKSKDWENTFPATQETVSDSALFMKRMLYIGFTQVIYNRGLLPQKSFKKRYVDRLRIQVFNASDDDGASTAGDIRSACETLSKGYLRELHLIIGDEDREGEVVEVYKMAVTYVDSEPMICFSGDSIKHTLKVDYRGPEKVREDTYDLIVRLRALMESLAPLPESTFFSFYIIYDDEKTPKGYQAAGFGRRPEGYETCAEAKAVDLGSVHTNHHACSFGVQSVYMENAKTVKAHLEEEVRKAGTVLRGNSGGSVDTTAENLIFTKGNILNDTLSENTDSLRVHVGKTATSPSSSETGKKDKVGALADATNKLRINNKHHLTKSSPEEKSPKREKTPPKTLHKTIQKKTPGASDVKRAARAAAKAAQQTTKGRGHRG